MRALTCVLVALAMADAVMIALGVFALLGLGAWLEQGGKSKDEDYDDD